MLLANLSQKARHDLEFCCVRERSGMSRPDPNLLGCVHMLRLAVRLKRLAFAT